MVKYFRGKVTMKTNGFLVLEDRNGIGYEFMILENEDFRIGEEITLFTHTELIIENTRIIERNFGFRSQDHVHFFLFLLRIKGIGGMIALSIMSNSIGSIIEMLFEENELALNSILRSNKYSMALIHQARKPSSRKVLMSILENYGDWKSDREKEILSICKELNIDLDRAQSKIKEVAHIGNKKDGEVIRELLSLINNEK